MLLLFFVPAAYSQDKTVPARKPAASSPFAEAQSLLQQGSIADAKARIQEQLALHPSSVEGYNLLGIACTNEKDYDGALEAFHHALKLAPNSAKTRTNLGNVYVAQGKPDLAEKEFRTALTLDPANRDGNYNLGLVLMAKGAPAEAIPHFLLVRPLNLQTRFNLVRAYFLAGKTKEGLLAANQLSAQDKNDIQLHFTLGVLLASSKQYEPAQRELEKVNALQPETFEVLYNLGQAYLRGGKYENAQIVLNRALKLKPDSPETLYLLAQAASEQSRPADALDLLTRAHKLAPAEHGHRLPARAREHDAELFRGRNSSAWSRPSKPRRNVPTSVPPWARAISCRVRQRRRSTNSRSS